MTILDFNRDKVQAMAQSGLMHINSLKHWDVCDALRSGKTLEQVSDEQNIPFETVKSIKNTKCKQCR